MASPLILAEMPKISGLIILKKNTIVTLGAENGGYPPTQNGDIRSLFLLFSLMAMQN